MHGSTSEGWLFALANEEPSNWGDVDNFYRCMAQFAANDSDTFVVESKVWGRIQKLDVLPRPGDGFAFYHSSRAKFPENDVHGRKQRISLIGELQDIRLDGPNLDWIKVIVDRPALTALRKRPIVRKPGTQQFFERCGLVPGAVATLYHVDVPTWAIVVRMLEARL